MKDFSNKVAVITGAGSGIGRSLALQLAQYGAQLALSDIDADSVAETANRCRAAGAKAVSYRLNVADRTAVYAHTDQVRDEFGTVNLLFNNAGVALSAEVIDVAWEDFDWLMNINFWGVVHGTKAFLPHLLDSNDGHIINISSVFGLLAVPSQSAYNAAKFAVRGFTESLRQELRAARHPVGVTCVHPGGIKTNIAVNSRGVADHEQARKQFDRIAMTHPDAAARIILRGVQKDRPRVLVGPDARLVDAVTRFIGPPYQNLGALLYRHAGGGTTSGSWR